MQCRSTFKSNLGLLIRLFLLDVAGRPACFSQRREGAKIRKEEKVRRIEVIVSFATAGVLCVSFAP
jgi:hypothetical protein